MSSTSVSNKSFRLSSSPLKTEEELAPKVMEKQGIVSILGSDCEPPKVAASFRRTLSADMSSKKWLAQNGFKSPKMKRIASSEQIVAIISAADSSSSSGEEEEFEGKKELNQNPRQVDVWSSIISQNKNQELPPPYVHPLVKKSSGSLSEKSLGICTENLGSETGSEGFSSYPLSETGSDADDFDKVVEEEEEEVSQPQEKEYLQSRTSVDSEELPSVAKYNYHPASKKVLQPRSFPPPLPSLTRSSDGPSLHMHSHRENGRLVLEAVPVPSNKNFHAQRQDGRLLLTLLNTHTSEQEAPNHDEADQKEDKVEVLDFEEVFEIFEEEKEENGMEKDDDEEEEIEETEQIEEEEEDMAEEVGKDINGPQNMGIVMEQAVPKMTSGVINVHRSALMMKKLMGPGNKNPTWSHKFNCTAAKLVESDGADEEEVPMVTPLPQSLPPRPRAARLIPSAPAAAATSFNAYEYFWRIKPAAASLKNPPTHQCSPLKNNSANKSNKPKAYEQKELVGLRSCKESRRSLLSWEPYCIATS